MSRINRSKINVQKDGFEFTPFRPTTENEILLKNAGLKPDVELVSFERNGERRTLIMTEMHYHHVCQGELAGEPYLVTFWAPCNSGVGLTPEVDGKIHWYGVPGIVNGLAVLRDQESNSLWDHITGECFDGPLKGERLPFWGIYMTTVEAELADYPDVVLLKSPKVPFFKSTMMNIGIGTRLINKQGTTLPGFFRRSMHSSIDSRLPEGENGLGVMTDDHQAKFYPMNAIEKGGSIEDDWMGRKLIISRGPIDGVPRAKWAENNGPNGGGRPMQLLTRWYGFSFTYPDCEIYQPNKKGS